VVSGDTLALIPSCFACGAEFRLASRLAAARMTAGECGHPLKEGLRAEESPDAAARSAAGLEERDAIRTFVDVILVPCERPTN
jgi:hypothetical protein